MTDRVAEARSTLEAAFDESSQLGEAVHILLAEIDQEYTRGYTDAIEAALVAAGDHGYKRFNARVAEARAAASRVAALAKIGEEDA